MKFDRDHSKDGAQAAVIGNEIRALPKTLWVGNRKRAVNTLRNIGLDKAKFVQVPSVGNVFFFILFCLKTKGGDVQILWINLCHFFQQLKLVLPVKFHVDSPLTNYGLLVLAQQEVNHG